MLRGSWATAVFPAFMWAQFMETWCYHFLKCMNQELYLENHATHKNATCIVKLARICTFQWYQYCSSNVYITVSTVKNYINLPCGHWGSNPFNISATSFSTQSSYKYQPYSSRVLQLPNGVKILVRVASEKEQEARSQIIECFGLSC